MQTRRLCGVLWLAACATTKLPVEQPDPCDPRNPARVDLGAVNRTIAERLDFTRALAEEIEPCANPPVALLAPADEPVARCRAQAKTPGCVWACAVAAYEQRARDDAEAVNHFVEELPALLKARPDCAPQLSSSQQLLRCLGVSHRAIRYEYMTVRAIDGKLESVDLHAPLLGVGFRFSGRYEDAGCGGGSLWSTYLL